MILMAAAVSSSAAKPVYTVGANSYFPPTYPATKVKYQQATIPGQGKKYLNCGEFIKLIYCKACDHTEKIFRSCNRCACPKCWKSWARKEKNRIVERIFGYETALRKVKGARKVTLIDLMLSPPQDYAISLVRKPGGVEKLRAEAVKLARANGVSGAMIYHEWRVLDRVKGKLRAIGYRTGEKFWKLIHRDALNLGGWKEYAFTSPHFHIAGYTTRFIHGDDVYNKTGWLWKNQGTIKQQIDLERKVFYFLSHAAIREGKRCITWFGALSYNKLRKIEGEEEEVQQVCPKCDAPLFVEDLETGVVTPHVCIIKKVRFLVKGSYDPPPGQVKFSWARFPWEDK